MLACSLAASAPTPASAATGKPAKRAMPTKPAKRVKPRLLGDARSPISRALFPRLGQKNSASLRFTMVGASGGLELGYRRKLWRNIGTGASFEYLYPNPGYGSIVTLAQSVEISYWIPGVFSGFHAAVRVIFAEYSFVRDARHNGFAVGAGAVVGWSWWLPFNLSLEVSGGVRALAGVTDSPSICSQFRECGYLRGLWLPRMEVGFGYIF